MKIWSEKRRQILRSPRTRWTAAAAAALLLLAAVPLPQRVRLPGEFRPARELRIVVPDSSRLVDLPVRDGQHVAAGQSLLRLDSLAARQRLERARLREARVEAEMTSAELDPAHRSRLQTMEASLVTARAARREAEIGLEQLAPVAPFPGVFLLADVDLRAGDWVERNEPLALLVGDGDWQVTAYLGEADMHLVAPGAAALFYPDGQPHRPVRLTVTSIERDAARSLPHPMLANQLGGSIPTRLVDGELVPQGGYYRVRFECGAFEPALANQLRRGTVVVHAGSESLMARVGRATLSVLWREAGF